MAFAFPMLVTIQSQAQDRIPGTTMMLSTPEESRRLKSLKERVGWLSRCILMFVSVDV
jgi:hypothetical protein